VTGLASVVGGDESAMLHSLACEQGGGDAMP
jgi:hypothetical protein